MLQVFRAIFAAIAATFTVPTAHAEVYPAKPLRLILPVSAGSGIDTIARASHAALAKALGQSVVIENLPGAGGVKLD